MSFSYIDFLKVKMILRALAKELKEPAFSHVSLEVDCIDEDERNSSCLTALHLATEVCFDSPPLFALVSARVMVKGIDEPIILFRMGNTHCDMSSSAKDTLSAAYREFFDYPLFEVNKRGSDGKWTAVLAEFIKRTKSIATNQELAGRSA